jgi:preprotein translocase subunit SecD
MRDTFQRSLILGAVVIVALLSLLPSLAPQVQLFSSGKWFTRPLAMGLDISGGVHLVYGVKAQEAVKSRLATLLSNARSELRKAKIAVVQSSVASGSSIQLTLLTATRSAEAKTILADQVPELKLSAESLDGGRPMLVYSLAVEQAKRIEREAIEQAVETLRNRVDQFGVSEPLIQRSGEDRIILQMPGVSDVAAVKKVVGSVAKLEFRFLPGGAAANPQAVGTITLKDKEGQSVVVEDQVQMTGDSVSDARVDFDQTGQVEVTLKLSSAGKAQFGRLTAENVGRSLAIILDGVVYSSPVIRDAITQGTASISGGFTVEEAKQLKVVLKAGALPAPLEVLEERTVGPSLGLDSVKKGLVAMAVGFASIAVFMVVYYLKSGLIAVGTLILNAVLMFAALSLFGATLTLPGLAGLALTIGMAVDSNVIIFERIRDELRSGAARDLAVHSGFEKAFSAIFDSNVTTLLAGALLYYFGTGPVRGFAVTLSIGIATTLFCAVFVARLCFDFFELRGKDRLSI